MSFVPEADLFSHLLDGKNWKLTCLKVIAGRPFKLNFHFPKVIHYEVHFVSGRGYVCPGEEWCPVCGTIGKRPVCAGFDGSENHVGMLEWGLQTQQCIDEERAKHNITNLLGTEWVFERKLARRPAIARWAGIVESRGCSPISERRICEVFARVYNLPRPRTTGTLEAFNVEARQSMIDLLTRSVYR